jgi:hypothetical protein
MMGYCLFLRKRSISASAILIAAARPNTVTPDFVFPSPKLTSHRQPPRSTNLTTEYCSPL